MGNAQGRHAAIGTATVAAAITLAAVLSAGTMASTGSPEGHLRAVMAPAAGALRQASLAGDGHALPAAAVAPISRILGRAEPGYRVVRAAGGLTARNRAQRLTARFGRAGTVVRSGPVVVRLRLAGYGQGRHLTAAVLAGPVARANRVVYRAGPLTQWYANGPAGLEQGFTVAAPPRATGRTARQRPLTIALAVSGNAGARLGAGGVVFGRPGHGLAYRDLVVSDARGRPLHAWLSLRPGTLMLHASTAGARYPLTVDPTFQQLAKLTASDGAGGDALGSAVAISGDTVVVGAPSASVGANGSQGAA
jgi:hypothetical protein